MWSLRSFKQKGKVQSSLSFIFCCSKCLPSKQWCLVFDSLLMCFLCGFQMVGSLFLSMATLCKTLYGKLFLFVVISIHGISLHSRLHTFKMFFVGFI